MSISLPFIRIFFLCLCICFFTAYAASGASAEGPSLSLSTSLFAGLVFGLFLICADLLLKRFSLRAFNTALLGLFVGYLMGAGVVAIFQTFADVSFIHLGPNVISPIRAAIYLFSVYLGMVVTARASEEIALSIPFIKFKPTSHRKKDILVDPSALLDPRMIDLAASGLFDNHLILPRFTLKELYEMAESGDESIKGKARRSLEVVKKIENIPNLDLRYVDTDFPEIKEPMFKLVRLARLLDANILTADNNRVQQSTVEGIRILNIHALSNALKPITQTGEYLNIKIQRYGKEPRQGVGYLEDGTMVVVNGGAEYIGELLRAQVLSVKHTSSGRMIFCNVAEEAYFSDLATAQLPLPSEHDSLKSYRLFETT